MTLILSFEQGEIIDSLLQEQNYPEAYRYVRDIVNLNNGDERIEVWLDIAAQINENNINNSYANLVRSTTIHAAQNQGMNLTLDQFQIASNSLARQVLSSIVNQGVIRDMDYIISEDVQSVVRDLGLTPEGWAGTVMGGLPVEFGGLGLTNKSNDCNASYCFHI